MGIFHMRVNIVKKATQSAIAKAAYVSGEKIYSERDEENKNYRKREIQPVSFILAPKHAPDWVYNREKLWNEVEKVESPVNSQLLREVVVALPIELTKEQNIELISKFVKENFVDDGMVADVNIHYDKDENPHAHILLTVRPFNLDGTWGFKSKKEYLRDEDGDFLLNDKGEKKTRKINLTNWNYKETLLKWRKNWANLVNEKYQELNVDAKISHLSNEKLGLEKVARFRLSREEYYVEEKAKEEAEKNKVPYEPVTTYGKINHEIAEHNAEIEMINEQIKSLNEEKLKLEGKKQVLSIFLNMRKEMFNEMERIDEPTKQAVEFLQKRNKVLFIITEQVNDFDKNLKNWKYKLGVEARDQQAIKEYLNQLKSTYENNPENLFKFGLTKETFTKHYNDTVKQFNYIESRLAIQYENYKKMEATRKTFKDAYYDKIYQQFTLLYPQFEGIVKFKTDENLHVMQHYLDHIFENKEILPVKEFRDVDLLSELDEHTLRSSISSNLEQYKKYVKLHFSFEKKFNEMKEQYTKLLLDNKTGEEVTKISLEYLKIKREFEYIDKQLSEAKNGMYNNLIEIYGDEDNSKLNSMKDKEKVAVLRAYVEERRYIDLGDLTQMRKYDQYQQQMNNTKESASDLLSQMLAIMASESMSQDKGRNKFDKKKKQKGNGIGKNM